MRIDLKSGQGDLDAVIDLREVSPVPIIYDGSDDFHARFGGRTYYHSRSGRLHKGWIPNHPWALVPEMLRADCSWKYNIVPTLNWVAFFDYRGGSIDPDYPIVEIDLEGRLIFKDFVTTVNHDESPETVSLDYLMPVNGSIDARSLTFEVIDIRRNRDVSVKKVLTKMFGCSMELSIFPDHTINFWSRLGLYKPPADYDANNLWYIVGEVLREVVPYPNSLEELQAIAPPNTYVFAEDFYVQGPPGYMQAVIRRGDIWDYEITLTPQESVLIFQDKEIQRLVRLRLESAIQSKIESQEVPLVPTHELTKFMQENSGFDVTIEHSLEVRNCEVGTRIFANKYFPNRTSVKLVELIPHLRHPGVVAVARNIYKDSTSPASRGCGSG